MYDKLSFKFDRFLYYLGYIVRFLRSARCLWRGMARDVAFFRKGGKTK